MVRDTQNSASVSNAELSPELDISVLPALLLLFSNKTHCFHIGIPTDACIGLGVIRNADIGNGLPAGLCERCIDVDCLINLCYI